MASPQRRAPSLLWRRVSNRGTTAGWAPTTFQTRPTNTVTFSSQRAPGGTSVSTESRTSPTNNSSS